MNDMSSSLHQGLVHISIAMRVSTLPFELKEPLRQSEQMQRSPYLKPGSTPVPSSVLSPLSNERTSSQRCCLSALRGRRKETLQQSDNPSPSPVSLSLIACPDLCSLCPPLYPSPLNGAAAVRCLWGSRRPCGSRSVWSGASETSRTQRWRRYGRGEEERLVGDGRRVRSHMLTGTGLFMS